MAEVDVWIMTAEKYRYLLDRVRRAIEHPERITPEDLDKWAHGEPIENHQARAVLMALLRDPQVNLEVEPKVPPNG